MMKRVFAFLLVICALSPIVLADDLVPPGWRGMDGTTFAIWEFDTDDPTPVPNVVDNPFGETVLTVQTGVGQSYWQEWGGRQGIWPLSGMVEIKIDNSPIANPYKEIWVQLTWSAQTTYGEPVIKEIISGENATLISDDIIGLTGESVGDGLWHHSVYSIIIEPNPAFETIVISGSIMLDELVIDTICIPEPTTMAMLAIGGLMLRRTRK